MMLSTSIAKKIFRNYKKAADAKNADSMFHVGVCYSVGYGIAKDEKMALKWCVDAAKAGSLDAKHYLAENCEIGEISVPAEEAFAWYHDAAETYHLKAMWKVICYYFHGYGTEKNAAKSSSWKHRYNIRIGDTSTSEALVHVGETLLYRAVRKGDKEAVKYLLRQDNVNTKDKDGRTPLHVAAESGHFDVFQILREEFQADIHAKDKMGMTALNIAMKNGNLEITAAISGGSNAYTTLSLRGNKIHPKEVQALAKSLRKNLTIIQLDLGGMLELSKLMFACMW
jgi:Ankyrin repeats (3 copies)